MEGRGDLGSGFEGVSWVGREGEDGEGGGEDWEGGEDEGVGDDGSECLGGGLGGCGDM